jgi:hypothetical protein
MAEVIRIQSLDGTWQTVSGRTRRAGELSSVRAPLASTLSLLTPGTRKLRQNIGGRLANPPRALLPQPHGFERLLVRLEYLPPRDFALPQGDD